MSLTGGEAGRMKDREKKVTGKVALMDLERCFQDAIRAWEQCCQGHDGRSSENRAGLEDRLVALIQSAMGLARAERLDETRIVTACGFRPSDGVGVSNEDDKSPSDLIEVDGMQAVRMLDDLLELDGAIWMSDAMRYDSTDTLPYGVLVRGDDVYDLSDEWTFGTEWNDNVARGVSYCHVTSNSDDGTARTTILFNHSFDENAVDIVAVDGKTHIVLVQGLVPTSFGDVWRGIGYQWRRYGHDASDELTDVTFPTLSVSRRMGDGDESPVIEVSSCEITDKNHRRDASDVTDGTESDNQLTRRSIWFNDVFMLFVYEEPFDGYDAEDDFGKVSMPSIALFAKDIKLLQRQAELLTEYDPDWGRDIVS